LMNCNTIIYFLLYYLFFNISGALLHFEYESIFFIFFSGALVHFEYKKLLIIHMFQNRAFIE